MNGCWYKIGVGICGYPKEEHGKGLLLHPYTEEPELAALRAEVQALKERNQNQCAGCMECAKLREALRDAKAALDQILLWGEPDAPIDGKFFPDFNGIAFSLGSKCHEDAETAVARAAAALGEKEV